MLSRKRFNNFGQCEDFPSICTSCTLSDNCQSCIDGEKVYVQNAQKVLNATQCITGYYVKGYKYADNCTTCFDLSNNCASQEMVQMYKFCDMCQNSCTECYLMKNKIIWFLIINVKLVRKKLSNVLFQLIVVLNARLVFFRGFELCKICLRTGILEQVAPMGTIQMLVIVYLVLFNIQMIVHFNQSPKVVCYWIHNMSINILHTIQQRVPSISMHSMFKLQNKFVIFANHDIIQKLINAKSVQKDALLVQMKILVQDIKLDIIYKIMNVSCGAIVTLVSLKIIVMNAKLNINQLIHIYINAIKCNSDQCAICTNASDCKVCQYGYYLDYLEKFGIANNLNRVGALKAAFTRDPSKELIMAFIDPTEFFSRKKNLYNQLLVRYCLYLRQEIINYTEVFIFF
ncbi:unnamed protein product [Paramecium octaurelia]|uniref:Transmembrane protein n=1 Tax=Paramecium octaurelia TaxID=43137 RepID=A0A8S1YLX5_PAROT|nr:unnamed protein product [Paramecium octaurelia]